MKHYKYNPTAPGEVAAWPEVKKKLDTQQFILYNPEVIQTCVKRIQQEMEDID